jgi:DNA-directed RNA polymerase I, II, and III subunit RPABC2
MKRAPRKKKAAAPTPVPLPEARPLRGPPLPPAIEENTNADADADADAEEEVQNANEVPEDAAGSGMARDADDVDAGIRTVQAFTPASAARLPVMTLYERVKVVGLRAEQLARGAQAFVHVDPDHFDAKEVAEHELREKRLPFIIKRRLPGGRVEVHRVDEMIISL